MRENTGNLEFRAGNYKIMGKIAEHTYVYILKNNETIGFTCYGGISYDGGSMTAWGDEVLARTIACFDPYDVRSEYNKKSGGYMNAGDSSGIKYGLNGVCHQMANRILVACGGHPQVNKFTPSSSVSYMLFGPYGKNGTSAPRWSVYLAQCVAKANKYKGINDDLNHEEFDAKAYLLDGVEDKFTREVIELEMDHENDDELPVERMKLLIKSVNSGDLSGVPFDKLSGILRETNNELTQLVENVNADNDAEMDGHYDKIDSLAQKLLKRFDALLTPEKFEKFFGFAYDEGFELIDKSCLR